MAVRTLDNGGGSSSTVVIELEESVPRETYHPTKQQRPGSKLSLASRERRPDEVDGALPSPVTAVERLQKWNGSSTFVFRTIAANYSFIIMGANDAAYGAIIPYVRLSPNSNVLPGTD